jgi:hypothetical protein
VLPESAGAFFTSSPAAHASSSSARFVLVIKDFWTGLAIRAASACEVKDVVA